MTRQLPSMIVFLCAAAATATAAPWQQRRLIVAIWERRAPETQPGKDTYGVVQRTNRETLLSLLYGDEHLLAGSAAERKITSIVIFPEGLPSHQPGTESLYTALGDTPPEHLGDTWLPEMLSIRGPTDGLSPVVFRSVPERDVLDRAIRDQITFPLVGLVGTGWPDESYGKPNQGATRAVSHPPLVTPFAIHKAASDVAAPNEPFTEVCLVWLHAGERNYAITIPQKMIERDYGLHAGDYYRASRALYSITPDVTHTQTGELANGNVTVWRVRRLIENAEPTAPLLVAHGRPAAFEKRGSMLDVSMFPAAVTRWLRRLTAARFAGQEWSVEYPDRRFRPIDAAVRLQRSGRTYPLPSPTAAVPIGTIVLDANTARDTVEWNVADSLVADVRVEPVERLPEYLQRIAVPIPTPLHSPAAPITIAITTFPADVTKGLLAAIGVVLLYWLYRAVGRFKKRSLTLHLRWDVPSIDEIKLRGPDTKHIATVRLWLLDQASYKPVRRRKLNVALTMDAVITEVPLREGAATLSRFVRDGELLTEIELALAPSRSPTGDGTPVQIRFDPSAVDFTRLRAGREISGAYSFDVNAVATGRYRALQEHASKRYRVVVQAFPPQYVVDGTVLDEIEHRGLFYDPKLSAKQTERRFDIGWTFVENPPVPDGAALDIVVTGEVSATGRVFAGSESHVVEAFAARRGTTVPEARDVVIPNGGRERWDVYVTIPAGVDWAAHTEWKIAVDVMLHVRVAGSDVAVPESVHLEFDWYPVNKNDFICIDLGTSASRLLVQGSDDSHYGFLPFPDSVRGELSGPEDLPAVCHIEGDHVTFGMQAFNIELDPRGFRTSLKQRLLEQRAESGDELRNYLEAMLRTFYEPAVHDAPPDQSVVDLRQPRPDGSVDIVPVMRGPRHLAMCSIPNEASLALRRSYEMAIRDTNLFRRVDVIREAEAVALDFVDRRHLLGGPAETLRILALDIGAGTSDAALVTADLPRDYGEPSAAVIAAAGVPRAGGRVDRAIFDILAAADRVQMRRDFPTLDAATAARYLRECERIKKAMAAGALSLPDVDFENRPADVDVDEVFASPEYQKALYDIIDVPLKILLGRLPINSEVIPVSHLLLTGRGSLMKGVRDRFLAATEAIRTAKYAFENASGNPEMLKAAVTLGARSFARKQWASLRLSTERFPDRVMLLAVDEKSARPIVAVDAGDEYPRQSGIHREVPLDWMRWTRAAVIRTYLRPDARFGSDLHLDEDAIRQVLGGRQVGPYAGAYTLLQELRRPTKRKNREWFAVVDINRNGEVSVREEAR
jgi:hypothetical protein